MHVIDWLVILAPFIGVAVIALYAQRYVRGAPVCRTQKMPSSIRRGSLAGRPVRALLRGMCGSTNAHCSSVSWWRFMRVDLRDLTAVYHPIPGFSDRA